MKRKTKPKPATAGEKIAGDYAKKLTSIGVPMLLDVSLSRRIDRAIARAVKNERAKCDAEWRAYIAGSKGGLP